MPLSTHMLLLACAHIAYRPGAFRGQLTELIIIRTSLDQLTATEDLQTEIRVLQHPDLAVHASISCLAISAWDRVPQFATVCHSLYSRLQSCEVTLEVNTRRQRKLLQQHKRWRKRRESVDCEVGT